MSEQLPHNEHETVVANDHLRGFLELAVAAGAAISAIDQKEPAMARLYLKAALDRLQAMGVLSHEHEGE